MKTDLHLLVATQLIGIVLVACLWSPVGAVVLRASAKYISNTNVRYWNAVLTVLLAAFTNILFSYALGYVSAATGLVKSADSVGTLYLVSLIAAFFIQSGFIWHRARIPFGQACGVTFTMIVFTICLALVVWGILLAVGIS